MSSFSLLKKLKSRCPCFLNRKTFQRTVKVKRSAVFLMVVALGLVSGCTTGTGAAPAGGGFRFVSPGGKVDIFYEAAERQLIPEIVGEDLMNPQQQLTTMDYGGKVVVLNIWGQWCGPCRSEALELQQVHQQTQGQNVQVLGLNVIDDNRSAPQDFMRDRGITYPSIYDPPGRSLVLLSGYPRNIIPSTIILDKQQRVAAVFLRELLAKDLYPVIDRLLAE